MTITEALTTCRQQRPDARPFETLLVCGFSPLHLETLLAGHLQQRLPEYRVSLRTGSYGDVSGTLERLNTRSASAIVLAIEWQDLDPRLGYREAGLWGPAGVDGIVKSVKFMLDRIAAAIERIEPGIPIALSLPTLPFPPLFHTSGWQAGRAETELEHDLLVFALRVSPRCLQVNRHRLESTSPWPQRMNLKSDLAAGLPYTIGHADAVAANLARLLAPDPPRKGLITDLDDALWHGLVGEVGPAGVCWDIAGHQQIHGLYQKLLASLAEEGVLIAIASKNDSKVVEEALKREDLILPPRHVFPVEVHWNAKSTSVSRILSAWNVGPESVVFVDDSQMELAEVASAFPAIECIAFPRNSPAEALAMMVRLRDLFGRSRLSVEDAVRLASIRQGLVFRAAGEEGASELFLEQAEARVKFDFDVAADPRVLDLVNKTNQFNLNGERHTSSDWARTAADPRVFVGAVTYEDKFGPLGKIAVVRGSQQDDHSILVDTWVMSCRAFARRIEHQCLKVLYDRFAADRIVFRYSPTQKNSPLCEFFAHLLENEPSGEISLKRERFETKCPPLYHEVMLDVTVEANGLS